MKVKAIIILPMLIMAFSFWNCSNFQFTKFDALLYNNKLMRLQQICDSAKLELKSAINSMKADSIQRTYNRFKLTLDNAYETWQNINPELKDAGLYVAIGANIIMYQENIKIYYNDIIYFYTHTLPSTITQRSIDIRGKVQMAQVRETDAYQYVLQKQTAFISSYHLDEEK
jgi:hypothetical protein